jgi:L-cysteine S-thiosulfotransferase
MSPALQALQDDTGRNPGTLWVEDGRAQWRRPSGSRALSCADCHQDAAASMPDVATRYPAWDERESRALSLELRIERCRSRHQDVHASAPDANTNADTALALQAYLTSLARGKPITPAPDERMRAVRTEGERLYRQRMGQLDLSCAQCHDERAGLRLAGANIPQAHPTGYPLYRLQWQGMGTLERRLRNCTVGVRAQPWPAGDASWVALEAYLMQRAAGMPIESPAVRP